MPSELTRHRLYEEIQEVLSPESADELMGCLPPVGWADVATKADIGTLRTELRGDLAMAVGQLKADIADVNGNLATAVGELKGDIADVNGNLATAVGELKGEITDVNGDLATAVGELKGEIADGMRQLHWWILGSSFSVGGLVLAAVRLGS